MQIDPEDHELDLEIIAESRDKPIKTIIPPEFIRVDSIDYALDLQKTPFFLNNKYKVNSIEQLNVFLKQDDAIISEYLSTLSKCHCIHFSELVVNRMSDMGIKAAQIYGFFDMKSNLDKVDLKNLSKTPNISLDLRYHAFVAAKVEDKGIINEFVFDYSGDQFGEGSVVPIVGPRDKLAFIYGMSGIGPYGYFGSRK